MLKVVTSLIKGELFKEEEKKKNEVGFDFIDFNFVS